ncbi:MAG: glycosyltransferase [Victivallales bacterium]|nr:glycosyltransferase [Victivallales bacterium]
MPQTVDASFLISVYRPHPEHFLTTVKSVLRVMREASCTSELLLCDDGSPEDCSALLEQARQLAPDMVRAWRSPQNRGIGPSRCAMVEASRGRYLASFDQDDIMLPFGLDRVIGLLDANRNYSSSDARKWLFDENGLTGEVHGNNMSRFNMLFTPKVNINAMLIRREDLLAHGSFMPCPNSPINDDVFLMIRLGADTDLHYDAEVPRALYRVHAGQNSLKYAELNSRDFPVMCQYIINQYPELYQQIQRGDIPECTPENFRIVQGLTGIATYFNQRDYPLADHLCAVAAERHPEDSGAWEHWLILNSGSQTMEKWEDIFRRANQQFADNVDALFIFWLIACDRADRLFGKVPEEVLAETRRLQSIAWAPPQIVLDNVPPPAVKKQAHSSRPAYTFVEQPIVF